MIFVRAGIYFQESRCQRYTVSKVNLGDRYEYVAWFKAFEKQPALYLGVKESALEAQGLCQGHFDSLVEQQEKRA